MAQSSPETNMAILANGAELTVLTVAEMMNSEEVRNLFGHPMARENVHRAFILAVHKKIEPEIRAMPTGQFNSSVLTGRHQAGTPNINVQN